MTKPPDWHGLVAWDVLFNNLTTGLFLTAALGELLRPEIFIYVATVAYPLALLLLTADLVCLVLDLGDPLRFHHMLRVFKPTSPMSLGTWCLTAYSFPLATAAALGLLSAWWPVPAWARTVAVVLAIPPALGTAAYKGVLFSTTAQPGWRDARWLGGFLTSAALLLGCTELLALALLLGQERAAALLRTALVVLLVLNVVPLALLIKDLIPTLSRVYPRPQLARLITLGVGGRTVLPLGLLLAGESPVLTLLAVVSILLTSVAVRFVIIRLPHAVVEAGASTPRDPP